jgi:hypothetical protein
MSSRESRLRQLEGYLKGIECKPCESSANVPSNYRHIERYYPDSDSASEESTTNDYMSDDGSDDFRYEDTS